MERIKSLALILGVLAMSVLIGYLVFAWTEPTEPPPGGNVYAPLNVSSQTQIKPGILRFTRFEDVDLTGWFVDPQIEFPNISATFRGRVGIGTKSPSDAALEIKPSSDEKAALAIKPYGANQGETGELRFYELETGVGLNFVGFKAPDSIGSDHTYTLPDSLPSTDSFLKSSRTGVLSWASSAISWPLLAPDGSDSAPSYSFSSDSDTGIYWSNTTKLSFAVNGNNIMHMVGRRVGIGTVAPQAKLDVRNPSGEINSPVVKIQNYRDDQNYADGLLIDIARTAPNTDAYALNVRSGYTPRLYVRSDGNVGIGTTNPNSRLEVEGNIRLDKSSGQELVFFYTHDDTKRFSTFVTSDGGEWRVARYDDTGGYLDSPLVIGRGTGNVGIGTTSPESPLHVVGNAYFGPAGGGDVGNALRIEDQGTFRRIAFKDLRFWDWDRGEDDIFFNDGNVTIDGNLTVGGYVQISGARLTYESGSNPSCPSGYMVLSKHYSGNCGGDAYCPGCSVNKWDTNPPSCTWYAWCPYVGECCSLSSCSVSDWIAVLCISG